MQKAYPTKPQLLFLDRKIREYPLTLHDMPSEDRPREKLISHGPAALSVAELLAIILSVGTKSEDVLEISSRIIKEYGEKSILTEKDPKVISVDLRIPIVKACQIVACGELGRRVYDRQESGFRHIKNAKDVFDYVPEMRNLSKEHLRGLFLNSHNRIIRDEVISIGTVGANVVHPREVFRVAIECNASSFVLIHNHPSGEIAASDQDRKITEQLIKAGKIIGIRLLDHVIVTKNAFVSIKANYQ